MPRTAKPRGRAATPGAPAPQTGSDLLDMEQAIAALATTRPTFYRWLRAGQVKGVKVGRQWRFRRDDIERFLKGEGPRVDLPADIKPLITALRERLDERDTEPSGDLVQLAVQLAIRVALRLNASDLHLVPFASTAALQLRVDGALVELARFDSRLHLLLVERFKRMTGLDVAIRDRAQDGMMTLKTDGKTIDVRATVVPATYGEAFVGRFHDHALVLPSLEGMSLGARERAAIEKALAAPQGVVVFAGPTGSGKSTVMYACAQLTAKPEVRLVTVERALPYSMPQALRVHVDPERGMDRPAALRAVMRLDPDVIAIEELGDRETMEAAIECSVTGHLVLGCTHAPDAIAALRRLADLTSENEAALEEVTLIVAQRLVRRLCVKCATAGAPPSAQARRAELVAGTGGVAWSLLKPAWKRAVGCEACRDTGCRGRMMVGEALEVTRELRLALRRGATDTELRSLAVGQGFVTMAADGVRKAAEGLTTLDELQRSLPDLGVANG
jgi:excisionase family DNA binding protein